MASHEVEPGQFDDAPEEINGRGNVAYIDTVDPSTEPQLDLDDHAWPPSSDEEDEDHDSLLDEDDYYDDTRVEDEDWDIAERGAFQLSVQATRTDIGA